MVQESSDLVACQDCHLVHIVPAGELTDPSCGRCGSALQQRKKNSLSRAWAFLFAAIVLYVPANIYPIMTVYQFGRGEPDTILSGAAKLLESGMWPLALLVFVASVLIPILKIFIIAYLLPSLTKAMRIDTMKTSTIDHRPTNSTSLYRRIRPTRFRCQAF